MFSSETSGPVNGREKPVALALLASERPRNVGWLQAAGLLFGDWGTSRLYVLGLAYFFARGTSIYLIATMSLLILAVAWAYTQICRIYPDGGGVYTAAKRNSRTLAVIGALLLFADYVVTASLSSLEAFHYFGFGDAPFVLAVLAISACGAMNLLGPKHTSGFAIAAALGMVVITLLISAFAVPQLTFYQLTTRVGAYDESPNRMWLHFVAVVLALSGVEAIGNLTGVMKKPVAQTARRSIWIVAFEVALFNVLLALTMVVRLSPDQHAEHKEDMLAFLASAYVGRWAEFVVRALGGVLLLSACNTVITDMISVQYLMSRDGELPRVLQRLNRFGVPWIATVIATAMPIVVLSTSHDLEHLAGLYAIGVVGAVAINITLCSTHPRLHHLRRKAPMLLLGILLLAIWFTLAITKLHALAFVTIVLAAGLFVRALTKLLAARRAVEPSLLCRAIIEQLPGGELTMRKIMLGTCGSLALAASAMEEARRRGAMLVVCFIRQVNALSGAGRERKLTIDTDAAAKRTFSRLLELAHQQHVPVLPVYDVGADAAELLAENAAIHGCQRIIIGTSRPGALYHLIKGHFQRRLEAILPREIPVMVMNPQNGGGGA